MIDLGEEWSKWVNLHKAPYMIARTLSKTGRRQRTVREGTSFDQSELPKLFIQRRGLTFVYWFKPQMPRAGKARPGVEAGTRNAILVSHKNSKNPVT